MYRSYKQKSNSDENMNIEIIYYDQKNKNKNKNIKYVNNFFIKIVRLNIKRKLVHHNINNNVEQHYPNGTNQNTENQLKIQKLSKTKKYNKSF